MRHPPGRIGHIQIGVACAVAFVVTTLIGLPAAATSAGTDGAPYAVITDTDASFWFPVERIDDEWQWATMQGVEHQCGVIFRLGGWKYEVYWLGGLGRDERNRTGAFEELLAESRVALHKDNPPLQQSDPVLRTGIEATRDGEGLLIRLTDPDWICRLTGARLDSVKFKSFFMARDTRVDTKVAVEYRVAPDRLEQCTAEFETWLETQRALDAPPEWDPLPIERVLISIHYGDELALIDEDGRRLTRREIDAAFGEKFYGLAVPRDCHPMAESYCPSYAVRGRTLYFTNGSLHEVDLDTGDDMVLLQGTVGTVHYGRYYDGVSISPAGRYLVVGAANATSLCFLYSIDDRRAVSDAGPVFDFPLWSRDGSIAVQWQAIVDVRILELHVDRNIPYRSLYDDGSVYSPGGVEIVRHPRGSWIRGTTLVKTSSRPLIIGITDRGLYYRDANKIMRVDVKTGDADLIHREPVDLGRVTLTYIFDVK
jgi:hypothetical protein